MKFRTSKYSNNFWEIIILWNKSPDDNRIQSMYDNLEDWEKTMFDYNKEFKQNAIERIKNKTIWKNN
jgi:ABC-type transporter lipoprotein component MlaA